MGGSQVSESADRALARCSRTAPSDPTCGASPKSSRRTARKFGSKLAARRGSYLRPRRQMSRVSRFVEASSSGGLRGRARWTVLARLASCAGGGRTTGGSAPLRQASPAGRRGRPLGRAWPDSVLSP
eukprot:scaffold130390_cov31-Tisochrysis_lutea.AAC.1